MSSLDDAQQLLLQDQKLFVIAKANHAASALTLNASSDSCLPPAQANFWSLDTIGITDDPVDNTDAAVSKAFHQSVQYRNGRYQVR